MLIKHLSRINGYRRLTVSSTTIRFTVLVSSRKFFFNRIAKYCYEATNKIILMILTVPEAAERERNALILLLVSWKEGYSIKKGNYGCKIVKPWIPRTIADNCPDRLAIIPRVAMV